MIAISRRAALLLVACAPLPALAASPTQVTLWKNPQCECCEGYAAYLRQNGFAVEVKPTNDLATTNRLVGVPEQLEGCHISFIESYVVEGHVPIEAVRKLLADRAPLKGISLPGMPTGSPGMEGPKPVPFTIYAIAKDGSTSVYMKI